MALRRARALNFLDLAKLYPSSSHLLRSAALPDQSPSLPCRILPRRPILRAAAGVRRELWCGLGFLLLQTLGFFRLTFWELSWDVMEPVCFYVTSSYFMAGYSFFLKTSKEPSFEGFFEIRFAAKQGRLLRDSNFDLRRFDELKRQVSFFPHQRVL
ncbi:calcium uniporter protein 2, mitochondrial-like [Phalaenopsis equestris]|uniref:calcium uniporter protein 2, mitochondrial-like n=1 Tax=Phalaenopsis equestris TaxID=78828 RepID=UPI0009E2614B|nr:calcium uniporter protein 2, mitochondrial-like [Phalaenopsis equestris]